MHRCASTVWHGTWDSVVRKANCDHELLRNRFHPESETTCNMADLLLLAADPFVRGHMNSAMEQHLLWRLRGVRHKLWLVVGTSIEHYTTRVGCPELFGQARKFELFGRDRTSLRLPTTIEYCTIPTINLTIAYVTALCVASCAGYNRSEVGHLLDMTRAVDEVLPSMGWPTGAHFLTLGAAEWDFQNWMRWASDEGRSAYVPSPASHRSTSILAEDLRHLSGVLEREMKPMLQTWLAERYARWPSLQGIWFRTMYFPKFAKFCCTNYTAAHFERYNRVFAEVAQNWRPQRADSRRDEECGRVRLMRMDELMRNNAGIPWTSDGLHMAAWVMYAYTSLAVNVMADVGELCD